MNVPSAKIVFSDIDKKEILKKMDEILTSGYLTLGKYVKDFENKFAEYIGLKYAVGVSSGTSSIEIILRSLKIKDSSVVVPTNTFAATAFAVDHSKNKIIFADCAYDFNIDPDSLNEVISKDTKALILVHIGGNISNNIEEIKEKCEDNKIILIEDAAHAHGSSFKGIKAGAFGYASSFSFYPTKVITSGEGGMILTDDKKLYEKACQFRDQGKESFFSNKIVEMGYNWRMSEIHAVIGIEHLKCLDSFIEDRRRIAEIYNRRLKEIKNVQVLELKEVMKSNYYKYIAVLKKGIDRVSLKKELKKKFNVSLSGEVYDVPLHLQPIFKKVCKTKKGDFPVSEDLCSRQICLPNFATMTNEQANYVIDSLKELLKQY